MKKLLALVYVLFLSSSIGLQAQQAPLPAPLKGNWINEQTNLWELGLWDDFAVTGNAFWDYTGIRETKRGKLYSVELRSADGQLQKELTLQSINDSTLLRMEGPQKVRLLKATATTLRRKFPVADPTPFRPVEWKEDSVVIQGFMVDYQAHKERYKNFRYAIPEFLKDLNYISVPTDEQGRFRVVIPLYSTPQLILCGKYLTVEAGDHLMVSFSHDQPNLFMGDNARLNQETDHLYPHQETLDKWFPYDMVNENMVDPAVWKRNVLFRQLAATDSINRFSEREHLSEKWRQTQLSISRNKAYAILVTAPFAFPRVKVPQTFAFPDEFLNYNNRLSAILESSYTPVTSQVYARIKDEYVAEKFNLSPEELDILHHIGYYYRTDTARISRLFRKHPAIEEFGWGEEMSDQNNRWRAEAAARITDDPDIRDREFGGLLFPIWEVNQQPLSAAEVEQLQSYVRLPLIKNLIRDRNEEFTELAEKNRDLPIHFGQLRTDLRDPDSILQAIITPHKGKVIYVNIWAAWSVESRAELKQVAALREELGSREVVYIYLVNNANEYAVRNISAEEGLTGDNVIHYNLPVGQQNALEKKYVTTGFPSYLLISPDGSVVSTNPPRPSQAVLLREQVDKLLEINK